MKVEISLPEYNAESGLRIDWDKGFYLEVRPKGAAVRITGNAAGLRSLARLMLSIARDEVPSPYDVHLDDSNSLEPQSLELVIAKDADARQKPSSPR